MLRFMAALQPINAPGQQEKLRYACMFVVAKGKVALFEYTAPSFIEYNGFLDLAGNELTRATIRHGVILEDDYADCDIRVSKKDDF